MSEKPETICHHDPEVARALYGFILAIISVLVDGAVLLGDKGIGFPTAAWWIETMRILALFGKLIGLGVAFYEGLLKE